ncbi:MAG: ferritin family protein [Proteobacteria bacterium]|nr:ferritin family protein [Pseudomonadota bacterium]MBU2261110.1 ferritin family protein [Pseudomonadota bacterium]
MEERMNALEIALKNEMNEHNFYLKNGARTANPLGKAMFEQIAAEELEHYERLKQLAGKWQKNGKWPDTVPLKVKETAVRSIFGRAAKASGKAAAGGDSDDLRAVRAAIEFEAKGAAFYAELRDKSTDPKEKAFFGLLANIEHEHFSSLKDTEEFFVNPGAWYQKAESSGLDGA